MPGPAPASMNRPAIGFPEGSWRAGLSPTWMRIPGIGATQGIAHRAKYNGTPGGRENSSSLACPVALTGLSPSSSESVVPSASLNTWKLNLPKDQLLQAHREFSLLIGNHFLRALLSICRRCCQGHLCADVLAGDDKNHRGVSLYRGE